MASYSITLLLLASLVVLLYHVVSAFRSPLSKIPGPKTFALTSWRRAYEEFKGSSTRKVLALHQQYGPAVRIGPNEVAFNSLSALRTIYGAGSNFERSSFYRTFEAYGHQNMFSFGPAQQHAERKRMMSQAYSKSSIIKGPPAEMIRTKVRQYLELLGSGHVATMEICSNLQYFSLDAVTHFLYGKHGLTQAMVGEQAARDLVSDMLKPERRKLAWLEAHFSPDMTWLSERLSPINSLFKPPPTWPARYHIWRY